MVVQISTVSIREAVNMKVFGWAKDEAFVKCAFEITTNTFESSKMTGSWLEGIASALMNCKGNILSAVTREVQ